jgi:asparagine synthase (glutamine-hydrolysing)
VRLGIDEVLTPEFMAQVDRRSPGRDQQQVWDETGAADLLNNQLAFDWRYTLAEIDLPKVCGTTQLAGIDVSFPLLDDALLEFSQRLPLDYKLRGKQLRWFFKEALRGFLPDEIITKPKQGFGLPFGVWMTRDAGLKALATDSLGALVDRRLAQPVFIKRLLDERLAEHPGFYGEMVWILMMMEQWLRVHAPNWRAA